MMKTLSKYWPRSTQRGHLRLASERTFSVFCLLAGLSGLGITLMNLPHIQSYTVTVVLGGGISLLCLVGPMLVVGSVQFERRVRIFVHIVTLMMLVLSLAARDLVNPSNLLFVPAVLTMTLAAGWRDGLFTLAIALCAFVGTFMMTGSQWATALPAVNIPTLVAGEFLAASFVFAGSAVFRRQMVRAAYELQSQTERAEAANIAKSDFLANVSHEIRTPLNGVLGMARILEQSSLQPTQLNQVRTILQSGELLLTTLNDILDLARIEAGRLSIESRCFDLRTLVDGLASLHGGVADDKGIDFELMVDPALNLTGTRRGDEYRLAQILNNLLSNAVKFTANGKVELAVLAGSHDAEVLFEVRDTGVGLSAEQQSRIFDKFTQADQSTSRKFGGSGLGLSIVKHLVESMRGKVSVASELGQGSCFTLRLSLPVESSEPDETTKLIAASEQLEPAKELRVLVVDDVRINREVMRGLLSLLGVEADYASSGEEAVKNYSSNEFDVIFLDISMPGMDGFETLEKIRKIETTNNRSKATIIAQTANVMTHQITSYEQAGFDGTLGKPVSLPPLQKQLKAVMH